MKIRKIKFENHYVLGTLELDFTGENGKAVDTVIFAGENGCGKTQILEELYKTKSFLSRQNNSVEFDSALSIEIELEFQPTDKIYELLEEKLNSISEKNNDKESNISSYYINLYRANDYAIKVKINRHNNEYECLKVDEYNPQNHLDNKVEESIEKTIESETRLQNIEPIAIYLTASFEKEHKSKFLINPSINESIKVTKNFTENAKAILEENIKYDNADFLSWAYRNIGKKTSEEVIYPRMSKFRKAFDKFFSIKKLRGHKHHVNENSTVMFEENDIFINIDSLSSGEKQLFSTASLLLNCSNKENEGVFILIDEPEIGMHPNWQKKILGFYKELFTDESGVQTSQIFVATHSPFIIHNPNRTNDKVIILKKNEKGEIYVEENGKFFQPSVEEVAINAFGLNLSKYSKSDKPLLVFEGKTDNNLFELAYENLYKGKDISDKFELCEHLVGKQDSSTGSGAKNVQAFLNNHIGKIPNKTTIAIFDADKEGIDQLKGLKNNYENITSQLKENNCIVFQHKERKNVFAICLVTPKHRSKFFDKENSKYCYISSEMLFEDTEILEDCREKPSPDSKLFSFVSSSKKKESFIEKISQNKDSISFEGFNPTFELIEKLLNLP